MRAIIVASTVIATSLVARAQLFDFRMIQKRQMDDPNAPGIQIPIGSGSNDGKPPAPPDGPEHGDMILSDIMGSQRVINIFASFARDIDSVSKRLDTQSQNTTVLAPLNSAISDLPRKPWEDPRDYQALGTNAYDGKDGEDRAHRNLRRFTEAHIVPQSPWAEGEKVETLGGRQIWWERKEDGSSTVQPDGVKIDKIASRVANGEIWVLEKVLNYA